MEFFGDQMCMTTYAEHGASDTHRKCPVPLFVDRNNMHGLKSAITYAKRIGLESVTGQAPGDDDDGNAAAEAPGKSARAVQTVSPDQYIKLRDLAAEAGVSEADVCAKVGASSLEQFPASKFDAVAKGLQKKIEAARPAPSEQITDDEIPY
jgi:hypothetical protein